MGHDPSSGNDSTHSDLRRCFVYVLVWVVGLTVLVVGSAASAAHQPAHLTAATRPEGVPRASHVFVIVGENTSLGQITRNSAPYIVGKLKPRSAWLTGYRAVNNSSSTGDYIEMTSGQSIKCERNDSNPVNPHTDKSTCHQKVNDIFHQLELKHISWTDWQESMPHPCAFHDDGTDRAHDVYVVHHNPAVYYDDIEGNRYVRALSKAPKAVCRHHDLPMGTMAKNNTSSFDKALAKGRVARFNYIVPNDCENSHDVCGTNNRVGQFDAFVKREVARIKASPAWSSRSVINVTWDEQGDAKPDGLQVGSIWYGARIKPGVYHGSWTHASLLRTVEDEFGLAHLKDAIHDNVIAGIWR